MKASKPGELPRLFLEGFTAGDVEAVVSLYEPDGIVAPDPTRVIAGRAAIRSMVSDFMRLKPRFVLRDTEVVQQGDLALVRSRWSVTTPNPDGEATGMSISPALVARRQADGCWLVAIDRPLSE
jgi:uncharacterized protein (TIGR02246 family)